MFVLLAAAVMLSLLSFLLINNISEFVIDHYMENSSYAENRNKKNIAALQEYITEKQLVSRDSEKLEHWIQGQKLLSLTIFKDGIMVFDSDYPNREIWQDEIEFVSYDWMSYETITFSDGVAEIQLTGAYRYQFYNIIQKIGMVFSFILFFLLALLGIRKKMAYIRQLYREVQILETGGLNYPITVKGEDELSILAAGLEGMRKSFLESRKREEDIVQKNQRMITEMSHDLRTPITSILLYTEIILSGKTSSAEQEKTYLEKIRQKGLLIKQRTDRLLEYSLKAERAKEAEMETGLFTEVFYEQLSDFCGYLEQKGFQVGLDVRWPDKQIRYVEEYVTRILDNITSNIVKYADITKPVKISIIEEPEIIRIQFQNHVNKPDFPVDSTGIGIQSIDNLMKKMGGEYKASRLHLMFRIELCFPNISDVQSDRALYPVRLYKAKDNTTAD